MDFEQSERAKQYADKVAEFVKERVIPNEKTYFTWYAGFTNIKTIWIS